MDQNSTNGTDKRNWRERLGIGSKEMPRISEEFQPPPAAPRAAATVKPAPMAPRAAPRAAAPSAAPRSLSQSAAPLDQEALASKLKSQRDVAEKLAEQRVQAARQRAEAAIIAPPQTAAPIPAPSTSTSSNGAAKPKFSFAEEAARPPVAAPVPQQRAQQAPLPPPQARAPVLPPARPQLGAGVPPRTAAPQYQPRQPLAPPPANYQPPYNGGQGYRPIDPTTGYPPAPQYSAGQGYAPPPRQTYAPQQPPQPRLQVPARGQPQDYGYGYEGQRGAPRLGAPNTGRGPALQNYAEGEQDDIFEQAPPRGQRRATAGDYQQAYREVESGYEDEIPRSRGPGILLALLALALVVGFGSVWAYNNYIKPQTSIVSGDKVPVVKAPDAPAKVSSDGTATDAAPANGQAAAPSKKQIYDRIVGDREVLGGQIVPTEETPVQPVTNSQPVPEPATAAPVQPSGTGDDGTPLPLPPPPGDNGGQQGSLEPSGKTDQQIANITPAAGASQAADSPSAPAVAPLPEAPAPGEQVTAAKPVEAPAPQPEPPAPSSEVVTDTAPVAKPDVAAKKIVTPKPDDAKKIAVAKPLKSLGAKPVVLVAPSKKPVANKTIDIATGTPIAGESLYGDSGTVDAAQTPQVVATPVKKKKSLIDLFRGETKPAENQVALNNDAVVQGQPELLPPVQKVASAQPAPAPVAVPSSNAFVAQLASFKTKDEAAQEYRNLSAKHGPIISRYAPIITQADVAGSTRYRLSIGPMASANVATGVCQSLFAAGERDCLVHRQ